MTCYLSISWRLTTIALRGLVVMVAQLGGWNLNRTLPQLSPANGVHIHHVPNPSCPWHDLGQWSCMRHLDRVMQVLDADPHVGGIIMHASSQGSATLLNYFGQSWLFGNRTARIRAMVIESILVSGNYTIAQAIGCGNVPGAPYVIPFLAQLGFMWPWSVGSPQGITSVRRWPSRLKTIPIMLLTAEGDRETPMFGARALYAFMHQQQYNVYTATCSGWHHCDLLELPRLQLDAGPRGPIIPPQLTDLHRILAQHRLPFDKRLLGSVTAGGIVGVRGSTAVDIRASGNSGSELPMATGTGTGVGDTSTNESERKTFVKGSHGDSDDPEWQLLLQRRRTQPTPYDTGALSLLLRREFVINFVFLSLVILEILNEFKVFGGEPMIGFRIWIASLTAPVLHFLVAASRSCSIRTSLANGGSGRKMRRSNRNGELEAAEPLCPQCDCHADNPRRT